MRIVKTLFLLFAAGSISSVNAADYFSCDFTELTAKNGAQVVKATSAQKEYRTVTGFGNSGRGGLFAMDNLEDFAQVAKMQPLKPHSALIFNGLKNFPASEGSCEMWIAPYFNQVHAYRDSKNTNLKLSYIFSLFCNKKGTNFARDGKSTIFAYIHGKQLKVHFVFTDGKAAVLSTSIANWKAKQFRKITLTWKKGNQRLYIDQKLAAETAKEGTLADFNSIEIGGRDFNLSFQGVIDDIKIFSGMPNDVVSQNYEGDPQKFKAIAIAPGTLDVWQNDVKTTALNVKKKRL